MGQWGRRRDNQFNSKYGKLKEYTGLWAGSLEQV